MNQASLAVFTTTKNPAGEHADQWQIAEDLPAARTLYKEAIAKPDTYVAGIAIIIESTDYDDPTLEGIESCLKQLAELKAK